MAEYSDIPDELIFLNTKKKDDIVVESASQPIQTPIVNNPSSPQKVQGQNQSQQSMDGITIFNNMDAWGFFFNMPTCECWSDKNKVYFTGEVFEGSMNSLIRETKNAYDYLKRLCQETGKDLNSDEMFIELYITSKGGSILEGFRYIDYVKTLNIKFKTIAIGYVASMGFILWILSEERYITDYAHVLIHQLSAGISGKRDDMLDYLKHIEDLHNQLLNYIKLKTGMNDEKISKLMAKETWLTSDEAVKLGLCSYIKANK